MAANIHINLTDGIEDDLREKYQNLCEDLVGKMGSAVAEFSELCNETHYEPMVNVVNDTIGLFDDDIKKQANTAFQDWKEGDGSFTAASDTSQAGDDARATAQSFENMIENEFNGFWQSHPMGEQITVDTSRPIIKLEDFDKLKDIYKKCAKEIADISEKVINSIKQKGEDDPTYNVILPAVTAITVPINKAFEKFSGDIDKAKEDSVELRTQQDTNNEMAWADAKNTSAEDVVESLEMFSDV